MALDWLSNLFTEKGFFERVLPTVATAGGAFMAHRANQSAQDAVLASQERARAEKAAADARALEVYGGIQGDTAGGVDHFQRIIASDPYIMRPAQQQQLDNLGRDVHARLSKSGLRGAGRTTTAVYRDTLDRARGRLIEENLSRQDNAAGRMIAPNFNARGSQAGLHTGTGTYNAGSIASGGQVQGDAKIADAMQKGGALGAIAGIFAHDREDERRDSTYGKDYKAEAA